MIVELSKGRQITIPVNIRNEFNLDAGSKLEILKKNDEIILRPVGADLDKIFKNAKNIKPKHNLDAEQMDKLNEGLFR